MGSLFGGGGQKKAAKNAKEIASIQAQNNLDVANRTAELNRYDEVNPFGSVEWAQDPETGRWTVTQNASPALQGAVDSGLASQTGVNRTAQSATNRVAGTVGSAFNPTLPAAAQTPTADPLLRQTPASEVPNIFGPNAGPVQTGFDRNNPYSSVFGAGATPEGERVVGGDYQSNLAPAGDIFTSAANAGPINGQIENAGPINRNVAPAGPVPEGGPVGRTIADAGPVNGSVANAGPISGAVANAGAVDGTVADAGAIQSRLGPQGAIQTDLNAAPIQRSVDLQTDLAPAGDINTGQNLSPSNLQTEAYQRSLDYSDAPALPGTGDYSADRQALSSLAYNDISGDINRQYGEDEDRLRQYLADRGIPLDSDAAKRELRNLSENRDDALQSARLESFNMGQDEQSRLFGLGMGARQQAVGETNAQGSFANDATSRTFGDRTQAEGQNFGQDVTQAQLQNQGQNQLFSQMLASGQFGNDAELAQAYFGNQAQNQDFAQNRSIFEARNSAQQQGFNQDIAGAEFANRSQAQQYGQNANDTALGMQAQGQRFAQNQAQTDTELRAQAQRYGQNANDTSIGLAAQGQRYGQNANDAEFARSSQGQEFGQDMASQGQRFGQNLSIFNAGNQAQQQEYGQNANDAAFALGAQGQQYAQNAADVDRNNQAQQQLFSQLLSSGQFSNAAEAQSFMDSLNASGQNFGQDLASQQNRYAQLSDAQKSAYSQALGAGQFYNQGQQQGFEQDLTGRAFENSAQQQQFDQNRARLNDYNTATNQDFANQLASAGQQNATRQQEFGIAADKRSIPINEALAFNQQSQVPQVQGVSTPGVGVSNTDYAGIYGNQLNYQANKSSNKLGAVGSLGSAAIMACWVAREVYGPFNTEWMTFRRTFFDKAPKWAQEMYMKHGEAIARFISDKPRIKLALRKWMDAYASC